LLFEDIKFFLKLPEVDTLLLFARAKFMLFFLVIGCYLKAIKLLLSLILSKLLLGEYPIVFYYPFALFSMGFFFFLFGENISFFFDSTFST